MRNCSTTDKDPFFILDNGLGLTRSYFIQHLRIILSTLGFNSDLYNGHSFRIGAATTAAGNKVEDHLIQTLGRWVSQSYV